MCTFLPTKGLIKKYWKKYLESNSLYIFVHQKITTECKKDKIMKGGALILVEDQSDDG